MSQNDFRAAIEKAIAAWEKAFNAKDAAAIANLYTDDASLLPPGSPLIKGRKNIQGFWQSFINEGGSDAKLHVVEVEDEPVGLVHELGVIARGTAQPHPHFHRALALDDGGLRERAEIALRTRGIGAGQQRDEHRQDPERPHHPCEHSATLRPQASFGIRWTEPAADLPVRVKPCRAGRPERRGS